MGSAGVKALSRLSLVAGSLDKLADAGGVEHCGVEQKALYILSLIDSSVAFCLLG